MKLRQKAAEELKSQLQDFLSNSPYAEQLQGLLDLSEEELQDTHAVQKFLEQEHLDPQIWNDYIDRLKVKRHLEHNQYFAKVDSFRKDDFLKIDFDLIAFFDQHGFLGRDISQTWKFLKNIQANILQKDELLKKLQFFTSKNILTPRNIYFFPIDLFYLSTPVIGHLEKLSFFDNNPFFDEESYLGYEGFIFQQYLILFCTGQDSNRLEKYETLKPIIDYKSPDFSEKLLRLIEVTKTKSAEELKTFFKFTQLILTENNYQELLEKLEQKFSLSDESDIFLLLKSWQKRMSEFLNMNEGFFVSLIQKIKFLRNYLNETMLQDVLSQIFEYDNYQELLEKLEQKFSLSDKSDIFLLLKSWQKRMSEFLNMNESSFSPLIHTVELLRKRIHDDIHDNIHDNILEKVLSDIFHYDNYQEILHNLLQFFSNMSRISFFFYYKLQNNSFTHLWMNYTEDKLPYIQGLKKLKNSKIPELQHTPWSFLPFILESSDPLEALHALETVYSSSHLPQIVKNFSLFRLLYNDEKLGHLILNKETVSPYLKWLPAQERIPALYQDFLAIAINSNEVSLKNLITQLVSELPLLRKFENWLQELKHKKSSSNLPLRFSPEEQSQLFQLFETLEVLPFILHPETIDHTSFKRKVFSQDQLEAYYHYLLEKLKVSEWSFLADACNQSFTRWGYPQLENILNKMDEAQKFAMTKNVQELETQLTVNDWNFLKGIEHSETILQILQTGILSREYIGATGASSDWTPFDADFEELTKSEENQSLSDYLKTTYAAKMGSYLFLIKNSDPLFSKEKGYEKIIHNDEGHRGVRTGLPTSEISALIMPEEVKSEELEAFTYQIAKNGFYLPIYDRNGKLLFTLEDYAQLRKGFTFSPRYEGYILADDDKIAKEQDPGLRSLTPQMGFEQSSDEAESLAEITAKKIQTYLKELGIFVSLEAKYSPQEARLLNIGSTGRGTAIDLSAQDQDFVLILPPRYADKKGEIVAHLHEKIKTSKKAENEGPRENGAYQLRSEVNQLGKSWSSLPFDLLIMENIHGVQLSSAQAMQERLEHILKTQGKSAYDAVLSNIRAAKSFLAQHHIYKRAEGGLGGIGVEHWILQNEWSLEKALKSFASVAYQGKYHQGKKPLSLQEFQKQYPLYDTGYNRKNGTIDNYILKIDQRVYDGMLSLARTYLKQ